VIDLLIFIGSLVLVLVLMGWLKRRSKRLGILLPGLILGFLFVGWAVGDPSARTIGFAVWWLLLQSAFFFALPGLELDRKSISEAVRRQKWRNLMRLLVYFALGLTLVGIATALLTSESVVLWIIASLLLVMSIFWIVPYGWRLSFYGRISRAERAEQRPSI